MAPIIQGTPLAAWKAAAQHIIDHGDQHNLLVVIRNPTAWDKAWLESCSPDGIDPKHDNLETVIKTIFPFKLAAVPNISRPQIYARYLATTARLKRKSGRRFGWGSYFQRLICYGAARVNQLERIIEKINSWPRSEAALVIHISDPVTDAPRRRGGPCWHFGEIVWHKNGTIDLVAVYRNHDYLNKALGNFIALGMLLQFIAKATGKTPGSLICHSVHAYTDAKKSLRQLIVAVP